MSRVVRLGKVSLTFDMLTAAQKQELTGPTGPIGPQGKQGVQGASLILKNDWVSGTAYKNDTTGIDTVSYQGSYYGCKKSHTASASITPTNTTYWMLLAAKGSQGIQGIQGVKGADGSKLLFGAGEPAAATGKQGDAYLNTSNWDTFSKTSATTWTRQGNIKGKDGNAKVADNFTTADPTYALSAPKGKELHERLSQVSGLNLLINGDFQVWQRGDSFNTNLQYTADRWIVSANTVSIYKNPNGMSINAPNDSDGIAIMQYVENNLNGKTMTMSFEYSTNTGSVKVAKTIAVSNQIVKYKINDNCSVALHFDESTGCTCYRIILKNISTVLKWCKLEYGKIATPPVPRPLAEELMLCQRYYQSISSRKACTYQVETYCETVVDLPAGMRTSPSVTYVSVVVQRYDGQVVDKSDNPGFSQLNDSNYLLATPHVANTMYPKYIVYDLNLDAEIY